MVSLSPGMVMIAEPIIYDSYQELVAVSKLGNYQPQFVFTMASNSFWPQIGLYGTYQYNGSTYLGFTFVVIIIGFSLLYQVDDNTVKREQFIEYLEQHHPDYLEWFLFHPEYL